MSKNIKACLSHNTDAPFPTILLIFNNISSCLPCYCSRSQDEME